MKKTLLNLAVATLMSAAALPAAAWQAGDLVVRVGAANVSPTGDGTIAAAGDTEADSAWSLGITGTYMATDNIGIGVLGAWPFEHDVSNSVLGGNVAEATHLPPTVTMQYHFDTANDKLHPYAGIGVNYTNFIDVDETALLGGASLDLDDSWGLAAELGVDYETANGLVVSGQLWYIDIDTDATITNGGGLNGTYNVSIDPWVVMIGVGKKF